MEKEFVRGLVSVITPVYNAEFVISKTIDSILNQTYKNIEIVIVDDNSTDKSRQVIEKYLMKDSKIVYHRCSTNQGAGLSRNKALELAKGQYVAFLDADDLWHPEKIDKQVLLLQEKNAGFSFTAIEMIDQHDNSIKTKRKILNEVTYNILLRNTMIPTSTVLIDRFVYGDFRFSTSRGGQDYATWLKLLRNGSIAYGINESLGYYRVRNKKSLSNNKFKSIKQVWTIQTQEENINKFSAFINLLFFIYNAIKKYIL